VRRLSFLLPRFAVVLLAALAGLPAQSQSQLPPDIREKIDKLATDTLARTGMPSVSLVVVKDGQIAYLKAYGSARLDRQTAAKSEMYRFLREKLFGPLGMQSAVDIDSEKLGPADPADYVRYGLGPPHPALHEGQGWLFGERNLP
jgi:CubicO group peptidase (beta-lactamase class C family)